MMYKVSHKDVVIILFFLVFIFSLLHTKQGAAQAFRGGLIGGMVASQVAGDGYQGWKKAGPHLGAYVNLQITSHSLMQMNLAYVQKGSRHNYDPEAPTLNNYLLRLHYIELPLVYQYMAGDFKFEAGLSLDFLLSVFEEADFQEVTNGDWNTVTLNSVLGVVYSITDNWRVNLRSVNSISSIGNEQREATVRRYTNQFGMFNDVLQLSVLYQFGGDY